MSEKMDGIRAIWDGINLLSRQGKPMVVPQWFIKGLPNQMLDGELWMGRNSFDKLLKLVNEVQWAGIGYYIFDAPSSKQTYEKRMKELEELELPLHVKVAKRIRCSGRSHLQEYLDSITEEKGEGIMLREPQSLYTPGFTSSIIKVKVRNLPFISDCLRGSVTLK